MFPWYIKYPNQNDEILNLDWILSTIENLVKETDNFINLNTIKYADPILWNITSQYEANTIVVDPQTGDAYISTKAVPYGVHLDNTGYWTKIYNYADAINTLQEQIAAANERLSTTATAPRSVGELVWLNGILHTITNNMIAGDSYVEGSNCRKVTIEELLAIIRTNLATEAIDRAEADEALGERITSEAEARSEADTALGQRIDDEAEARADADTALGQRIDDEAEARADADTALGQRIDDLVVGTTAYNVVADMPLSPSDHNIYELIDDEITMDISTVISPSKLEYEALERIPVDESNNIIEIATYNVDNENWVYHNLLNGLKKYGYIKKALMSFGCNIALLQESIDGTIFQAEELLKSKLMRNFEEGMENIQSPLLYAGMMTLSYDNVISSEYILFTNRAYDEGLLKTKYDINGKTLVIYNVHIYYISGSRQDAQWDEMLSIMNNDSTPYRIIGGDLNVNLATYPKVQDFKNAGYNVVNDGQYITYPSSNSAVDGFITTSNIDALRGEVVENKFITEVNSDHKPLKIRFRLN